MTLDDYLPRLVRSGATVSVDLDGGQKLAPWPIDYLRVGDGEIVFWWTGDETRIHEHELSGPPEEGEDGEVIAHTQEGHTLHIEPIWDADQARLLRAWTARVATGDATRTYPEGGWRYGDL